MIKNRYLRVFGIIMLILGLAIVSAGCKSSSSGQNAGNTGNTGTVSDDSGNGNSDNGNSGSAAGSNSGNPGNGSAASGDNTGDASGGSDKCEITAFATGKADALLVSAGNVNVLIDTGEETDAELICKRLREKGIERLDLMIVTHFDRDHAGGVPAVMEQVSVDKVYYPDYANTKDVYLAFRRAVGDTDGEGKITGITEFEAGDLKFVIYPEESPEKLRSKSNDFDNDMSLVSMLYYKGHKLLFAGDIEKERITELLESSADLSCEWIKMPHHGRYNKKLKELLDSCTPSYAVITDSDEEVAATDTLVELQKRKVQTYSIRKGEIVTTVSDEGIFVKYAE